LKTDRWLDLSRSGHTGGENGEIRRFSVKHG